MSLEYKYHDIESYVRKDTPGLEQTFQSTWVLWKQFKSEDKTYNCIPYCKFNTVAGFWFLMNILDFTLKGERLIFMRENIMPKWEDEKHKYGANTVISFSDKFNAKEVYVNFLLGLVGETFCSANYDTLNITGMTCVYEKNYKQIRFWLSNQNMPLNYENIPKEYFHLSNGNKFLCQFLFIDFARLKKKNNILI
jgi:hypothetical protein